jgi:hypothetical protein
LAQKRRARNAITFALGAILICFGLFKSATSASPTGVVPILVGAGLFFLGWREGRVGLLVFGHACVVLGCFLITWGIYLLPYSRPVIADIFFRPLFWGMFSMMGGICAIVHGTCNCVRSLR